MTSKEEARLLRAATALALAGVEAAVATLAADGTEAGALDAALRVLAARGATVSTSAPIVRLVDGTALAIVDLGAVIDGYEGGVGRTAALPGGGREDQDAVAAVRDAQQRLARACAAGAGQRELAVTVPTSMSWTVRGVGVGVGAGAGAEPPLITPKLGVDVVLEAGMALSVEVATARSHWRDLVVVKP